MVLSLSVTALAASDNWTGDLPKLQLSTNYDKAANQVTAVVTLSDCSALGALHFELLYNNALLTFKSAEGDALQGAVMHNKAPGSVSYVWVISTGVNCSEAKNIMTVVFDSTGVGGEAAFSVHVTRVNNGQNETTTVVAADSTLTSSVTLPAGVTQPSQPSQPEQPSQPSQPEQPSQPSQPEQPSQPSQPEQPSQPSQPEQPSQPSQPEQPSQPSQPEQPSQPSQPEQPSQPSQPEQPSQPSQPEQPSQPSQPEQPSQPSQPEQPSQPSQPSQPEQPSQPSQPEQPSQPSQPDPDQPDQPDKDLVIIPTGVSSDSYTIDGQTVTVQHELACRVGYLKDGKYVALEATRTENGAYVFTAPEGVEQVLLVVKGDANGDGKVTVADISQLLAHILRYTTLGEVSQFAANADGNSSLTVADISTILAHVLHYTTLEW